MQSGYSDDSHLSVLSVNEGCSSEGGNRQQISVNNSVYAFFGDSPHDFSHEQVSGFVSPPRNTPLKVITEEVGKMMEPQRRPQLQHQETTDADMEDNSDGGLL